MLKALHTIIIRLRINIDTIKTLLILLLSKYYYYIIIYRNIYYDL